MRLAEKRCATCCTARIARGFVVLHSGHGRLGCEIAYAQV